MIRPVNQPAAETHFGERELISIFLFFLLFSLFFHFDFLLGPYGLVRIHDTFDTDFPHYVTQGKLLLKYGFFGWYPNLAGGTPSFISQHPPYYILSLVSAFVPLWLTYEILCVGYMALAGYGMFRMLDMFFQIDRRIAIFGGILFAISNPANITTVINEVFNYLFPIFIVWSIELFQYRLSNLQRGLRFLGLILISLLSYPIISLPFFPILHLALVLAYAQPRENLKRLVLQTILIWTGYVLLFVPSIYSLFEYIPFSHRTYSCEYHGILNAFKGFAYLLTSQTIRLPPAPLWLCGITLLPFSRKIRIASALVVIYMGIFAFFMSPFRCLLANTFFMKMDLTNFLQPAIILLVISGTLFLSETLALKQGRLPILACLFASLATFFPAPFSNPIVGISVLVMGLSLLVIIRKNNAPKLPIWQDSLPRWLLFMGFVLALVTMGMAAKQTDFLMCQPYARLYNNHPELNLASGPGSTAVFRVGTVDVYPGVAQSQGLETINTRAPLVNKYYKQLIKAIILPQLKDPADRKFFDTYWIDLYLTSHSSSVNPPDQRSVTSWDIPLLLMMNTKYLITRQPIIGIKPFIDFSQKIEGRGLPFEFLKHTKLNNLFKMPIYLYRFKAPFPRGYLANISVILHDHHAVMEKLIHQSSAELREKVFFAAGDLPPHPWPQSLITAKNLPEAPPKLMEYSPDRLAFRGNLKSPAFLVVSNNYDPHWFAWVNGKPAPIYRANLAFQAILLNQIGPYLAVLEYHDPLIWWLHLVSLVGIALFILSAWVITNKDGPQSLPPAGLPRTHPIRIIPGPTRAEERYLRLGLWAGITLALLYAAYLLYGILAPHFWPNSAHMAANSGRKIYLLAVEPMTGILLSIWIWLCERRFHLFSPSRELPER
jgi:hypothetical protein